MIPYRTTLDDWTVSMWPSDNGTLLLKIEHADGGDYLTRITGEIRMRHLFIGKQCAGTLHPTPFTVSQPYPLKAVTQKTVTKEALLAAEGAG